VRPAEDVLRELPDFIKNPADEALALPAWLVALARPTAWPRALALEVLAWGTVIAVAAALRLAALGDRPLGPDETPAALAAWRLWLGHPAHTLDNSALLVHLLTGAFALFGASDFVARLPVALAGIALVLAPLPLRAWLRPVGALGAGSLLALSPLLVFGSRRVDGAILVAALLAWLVAAGARALAADAASDTSSEDAGAARRWAYAMPVLAALLLATGSVAIPAALAALVAAALTWWPGRDAGGWLRGWSLAVREAVPAVDARWVGVLFAGTLLLAGTAGFTDLRGLQAALADPWVTWLAPYHPRPLPIPWLPALLLYDLPLVGAAAAGLALVARRNRPVDHFLLWWTALAALPLVLQPPDPVPYLLVWAVPLALLGGVAIGAVGDLGWTTATAARGALLAAVVALDVCCIVNIGRFVYLTLAVPRAPEWGLIGRNILMSLLVVLFLGLLHWRLRAWFVAESPVRIAAICGLALGLVFALVVNGRLNYGNYGSGGAELLRPEVLSPDLWNLVDEMQLWARQEPTGTIAVAEALRPSLLWHLRDVPTVQFRERPIEGRPERGVWLAGVGAPEGERRPWRESVKPAPSPTSRAIWNWWLYRNSWLVPSRDDIIVVR